MLACPEPERLRQLLADQLQGTAGEAIEVHVQGCAACQRTLAALRRGTQVGNAGLAHLRGLTELRDLVLTRRPINASGLAHLQGLAKLRNLMLDGTLVDDEALKHLAGLTQLEHLDLRNTSVTDRGLAHLHGMSQLKTLHLIGTRVTPDGVDRLRQKLPKAGIHP
jgi:hypothetical protein